MKLFSGIAGGMIAGVIGAAVWAAVVHFTHYEVGIIAWGIGLLVGVGVLIGSGREGGAQFGVAAAIVAVAAILLGKWSAVHLVLSGPQDDEYMISEVADLIIFERAEANDQVAVLPNLDTRGSIKSLYAPDVWSAALRRWEAYTREQQREFRAAPSLLYPQLHLALIADDVCIEYMDEGRAIDWPAGMDFASAWRKPHYPPEIWGEAERRWNAFSPAEQEMYRLWMVQSQTQRHQEHMAAIQPAVFLQSFSLFDLLWLVLAVGSAFQIASASGSEEE